MHIMVYTLLKTLQYLFIPYTKIYEAHSYIKFFVLYCISTLLLHELFIKPVQS